MNTPIGALLGIEFPLVAFSHCRDVVTAVSKAGGFGVLARCATRPRSWKPSCVGSISISTAGRTASMC